MRRKILLLIVILITTLCINPINATETVSSLKQKIEANNHRISELKGKLSKLKGEQSSIQSELDSFDTQIQMYNYEIDGYQLQIDEINEDIHKNEQKISQLNKQIDENNTLLEKRLRVMYEKGSGGYLEVILHADDIIDALTRVDIVKKIASQDIELLKQINDEKLKVEELKAEQETHKDKITSVKADIESKKLVIEEAQSQKQSYMDKLEKSATELAKAQRTAETANASFDKQIQKILASQSNSNNLSTQYAGGQLGWPAPGYYTITSPFGNRTDPISGFSSFHRGMDIGCPYNTTIIAANSGTVVYSGWHNSYGYYLIIDHGGGIATLYAHNNKLLVSTGDTVTKGQAVSLSGSTGYSTGPHLHFEVRVNGQVTNPMGYLK